MNFKELRSKGWHRVSLTISREAFEILQEEPLDEQINEYILKSRRGNTNDNKRTE